MNPSLNFTIIEDNPGDAFLLHELLVDIGVNSSNIHSADTLAFGIDLAEKSNSDCVFLDLSLPDSQGTETVSLATKRMATSSVIVVTGSEDEANGLEALKKGAQDYLLKGRLSRYLLEKTILYSLERSKIRNQAEKQYKQILTYSYHLAHDIKSPISRIVQLISLIKTEKDATQKEAFLDMVIDIANEVSNHISDLLEEGVEQLNFAESVNRKLRMIMSAEDRDNIRVIRKINHTEYLFNIKGKYIRALLYNLLSNAVKYHDLSKPDPYIQIITHDLNRGIKLVISDNGKGISEERLTSIFRLGSKDPTNPNSTGLGLNIVKEIVEAIGGTIEVVSELGKGSVFTLYLPTA